MAPALWLAVLCAAGAPGAGLAQSVRCENGLMDDDETDVDCGGPQCEPCGEGSRCVA
eukprot:SAG22_NODE_5900_length_934_cov_1.473054_2_plen_56_part_01